MDEINNMNEMMTENAVVENEAVVAEVVPEESIQMIDENTSKVNPVMIGVGMVVAAAVVGGIKHLKNKKINTGASKTKKKIHLRTPWTIEETPIEEEAMEETDISEVESNEETSSEE